MTSAERIEQASRQWGVPVADVQRLADDVRKAVAGEIADRLDEWVRVMNPDAEFFGGPWDCAGFVRSEYGEQT